MRNSYPVILVHGIVLKSSVFKRNFEIIRRAVEKEGYVCYVAPTDGFGTIEYNAAVLKDFVSEVLSETGAEKVNLICHSKGGLDSRYMIEELGMAGRVATLTAICTPFRGSSTSSAVLRLPLWTLKILAVLINAVCRLFGDVRPDCLSVARQLKKRKTASCDGGRFGNGDVYVQSFSATMKRKRDDPMLAIPLAISRRAGEGDCDGLVSKASAKMGEFKGDVMNCSVSHNEVILATGTKTKKEKILEFYRRLVNSYPAV